MERIKVSGVGGFLFEGSVKPFVPWGFNYDRDFKLRLIEEYWDAEWATIASDFREMKQLGANVVRVHLQFAKFMDAPDRPNAHALKQLARLLALAEETRLYLDVTGLACYRKADVPAWFSGMNEAERWAAQARFWEAIAQTCAKSPAVFCYNLVNEPIVPAGKLDAGNWLFGELSGFTYCQFITLDPAGRPRAQIARQWIEHLARAIRKHDPRTPITVGLLPNSVGDGPGSSGFDPNTIAPALDFLSVHVYPDRTRLRADAESLKSFRVGGKPLVVEEIFPLTCEPKQIGEFIELARPTVAGWIGFYWGRTPEELRRSTDATDALTHGWLEEFRRLNPNP
jgi:endo-1,4-beta-mannosidase